MKARNIAIVAGFRLSSLLAIILLFSLQASAANKTNKFVDAVRILHELDLPVVSEGTLGRLTASGNSYSAPFAHSSFKAGRTPLANAWLIETYTNKPSVFVDLLGRRIEVSARPAKRSDYKNDAIYGTWKAYDLPTYYLAITNFVETQSEKINDHWGSEKTQIWISLLFTAVALHDIGETEKAYKLNALVLNKAEDPKVIVSEAVTQLASTAYKTAMDKVRNGGPWPELVADIDRIKQLYGESWLKGATLDRVRQAAVNTANVNFNHLLASGFSSQDVHAVEILTKSEGIPMGMIYELIRYPWVLAPATNRTAQLDDNPTNALIHILDGGLDAFPLLCAVATNRISVRTAKQGLQQSHRYSGGYYRDNIRVYYDDAMYFEEDVYGISTSRSSDEPKDPSDRATSIADIACTLISYGMPRLTAPLTKPDDVIKEATLWHDAASQLPLDELAHQFFDKGRSTRDKKV